MHILALCSDKQLNETMNIKCSPFYPFETVDVTLGYRGHVHLTFEKLGRSAPFELTWLPFLNTLKMQKAEKTNYWKLDMLYTQPYSTTADLYLLATLLIV